MTEEQEDRLNGYREIRRLSEGRKVFLVRHETTGSFFVKKILDVYDLRIYQYLLDHPVGQIPKIRELMQDEDQLIVIEDYIAGKTLRERLDEGDIPKELGRTLFFSLCDTVRSIHGIRPPIIHRDIKPSNIIITPDEQVYLIDLNAARFEKAEKSADTVLMGTAGYAAPEQYGFAQSDIRTDIYALGKVAEELFENDKKVGPIIKRSTMLDPEDRYRNVSELERALRRGIAKSGAIWVLLIIAVLAVAGGIAWYAGNAEKSANGTGRTVIPEAEASVEERTETKGSEMTETDGESISDDGEAEEKADKYTEDTGREDLTADDGEVMREQVTYVLTEEDLVENTYPYEFGGICFRIPGYFTVQFEEVDDRCQFTADPDSVGRLNLSIRRIGDYYDSIDSEIADNELVRRAAREGITGLTPDDYEVYDRTQVAGHYMDELMIRGYVGDLGIIERMAFIYVPENEETIFINLSMDPALEEKDYISDLKRMLSTIQ